MYIYYIIIFIYLIRKRLHNIRNNYVYYNLYNLLYINNLYIFNKVIYSYFLNILTYFYYDFNIKNTDYQIFSVYLLKTYYFRLYQILFVPLQREK